MTEQDNDMFINIVGCGRLLLLAVATHVCAAYGVAAIAGIGDARAYQASTFFAITMLIAFMVHLRRIIGGACNEVIQCRRVSDVTLACGVIAICIAMCGITVTPGIAMAFTLGCVGASYIFGIDVAGCA